VLLGVNAGSGSITSWLVDGDQLVRTSVASTGTGSTPVSITASSYGGLVYALDASGTGSVKGFRLVDNAFVPIPNSTRNLGLMANQQPPFLNTPGQVGFTPDGKHLVATTKNNGSNIAVFDVQTDGTLSSTPVNTMSTNAVPFGFVFDPQGRLVVTEASNSSLSTYSLGSDGHYTHVASVTNGQAALCWVTKAGDLYYGANAGSATVTGYRIDAAGLPTLLKPTGVSATTDTGSIDLAASSDGKFLYVEAGGPGSVNAFAVNVDGSLTRVDTVTGLGAQQIEGIVAA
jgi:6-phosphogluconolactonase (cycloisomerase 2 family)